LSLSDVSCHLVNVTKIVTMQRSIEYRVCAIALLFGCVYCVVSSAAHTEGDEMSTRNLAKSLHTVTVLARLAQHLVDNSLSMRIGSQCASRAVDAACAILGLADMPDVYQLKHAAAKQVSIEAQFREAA
jgi:hypothetical protein